MIAIGGGSFLTELVEIAGGRNVYGDDPRPSLDVTIEDVVRRDPDVVFAGPESASGCAPAPAWRALRAVRDGRVLIVDTMLVGRPGVAARRGGRVARATAPPRGAAVTVTRSNAALWLVLVAAVRVAALRRARRRAGAPNASRSVGRRSAGAATSPPSPSCVTSGCRASSLAALVGAALGDERGRTAGDDAQSARRAVSARRVRRRGGRRGDRGREPTRRSASCRWPHSGARSSPWCSSSRSRARRTAAGSARAAHGRRRRRRVRERGDHGRAGVGADRTRCATRCGG